MDIGIVDTSSLSMLVSTGLKVTVERENLLVFTKETPSGGLCLTATIGESIEEPFAISYCDSHSILVLCCTKCSFLINCSLIHEYWLQNKQVDRILELPYYLNIGFHWYRFIVISEKYKSATFHPSDSSLLLLLGGCFYDTYRIGNSSTVVRLSRTIIDTNGMKSDSLSAILFPTQ